MAFEDQGSMDFKQHINLSARAWNIIENDMADFYGNRDSHLSNFLNRIFNNFYQKASSSITLTLEKRREKYAKILKEIPELELQSSLRGSIIKKFIEYDEERLSRVANSHPKGEGRKFRLNKANMMYLTDTLSDCGEDYYYSYKIGRYLKAVFEEFTELPYYKREHIFFINEIIIAKTAIKSGKCLKITISGDSGKPIRYYVKPYDVMTNPQSTYNYLVGYTSRADQTLSEYKPASLRISRIKEIKILRSKNGKITAKQKLELGNLLLKKGVAFLLGDVKTIKVKLTEPGKKYYREQLHLRPLYDDILDDDIYVFHCSERQIINYFIKFGGEALIIEPTTLKKYFLDFFSDSCHAYLQDR